MTGAEKLGVGFINGGGTSDLRLLPLSFLLNIWVGEVLDRVRLLYDPFHVALLSISEGTSGSLRVRALVWKACDLDLFRNVLGPGTSGPESKVDLTGEAGAYISDSGARSAGDVRAENSCRMLSDWAWVVCKEDCNAMRKDVDGEDVLVGP